MFYGTTTSGGNSTGTVFAMTSAGVLTTLFSFADANGTEPVAQLIQGRNGNFYGTTLRGGANENGEVFEITPSGSLTVLHSFDGTDGSMPYASVTQERTAPTESFRKVSSNRTGVSDHRAMPDDPKRPPKIELLLPSVRSVVAVVATEFMVDGESLCSAIVHGESPCHLSL